MQHNTFFNRDNPLVSWLLFLLLAFLWSGSYLSIKITVTEFPPIFAALVRVFISCLCLTLIFTALGKRITLPLKDARMVWCTGLVSQAIPFSLLFYAERYVTPSVAGIINSTVSFWSLLLGALIFRDLGQLTPAKVAGVSLGVIGMYIIFSPTIGSSSTPIGLLLLTGMALGYSMGALLTQHVLFKNARITFEANLVQQHMMSIVCMTLATLLLEPAPEWHKLFSAQIGFAFLYLGVFSTAIAWIIYFYLIKRWGAVLTGTVMYIVPILAIIWDVLFLHIMPTANQLLGTGTILLGVLLIQTRRRRVNLKLVTEKAVN